MSFIWLLAGLEYLAVAVTLARKFRQTDVLMLKESDWTPIPGIVIVGLLWPIWIPFYFMIQGLSLFVAEKRIQ